MLQSSLLATKGKLNSMRARETAPFHHQSATLMTEVSNLNMRPKSIETGVETEPEADRDTHVQYGCSRWKEAQVCLLLMQMRAVYYVL